MGAMYEKGQTKRYSRVASFEKGGKSNKASGDSERKRISKLAKEGDIDEASDRLMKMRDAEMRGPSKSVKRDMVRKIRDVVMGGGMPPMGMPPMGMPPPMNPMVPGMKGMPMMKSGGSVKTKKYVSGGRPMSASERKRAPSKPNSNPPDTMAYRRPKTKQMPRPTPSRPTSPRGAEKMKNMPRPASRPTSPLIKKAAEAKAKAQRMPRPASKPTAPRQLPPMARKRGMAAGGDIYTTPGGPTRGKSGKIKKMASGGMAGMIPKAGKKSPDSMGTSYYKGGSIDGCAMKGKTRAKRVKQ